MIITETVIQTWNSKTKQHYINKGYIFTRIKDEFEVKVEDLTHGSKVEIDAICDYCCEKYSTTYSNYINSIKMIDKCCCSNVKCMKQKRQDILVKKYNIINISQLPEIKEKVKESNLKNFGVEYVLQSKTLREEGKRTCIERYGKASYTQTEEYRNKTKQTSLIKYGVDSPNKSKIVQEKKNQTMYMNGTTKTSKQQRYLHKLFGGELNFPVGLSVLDIAYIDSKIYIEYDGSGHDLCVKKDNMSKEDFEAKEMKRYYALKYQGWKCIRIKSQHDKLPQDHILLSILDIAKHLVKSGHNWINIHLDSNTIETIDSLRHYDFGEISKIKK